ncbi:AbrB/MazE/SpoVT family DNA-binding domain-containing protein [Turneriella parva]|uniref:Transcriptional regulator, AbrB family n=1 Tax=Turneriella parva (strain ATCC BAA-1111 / DSM 21527 / NCTC 11395 / H) TaxID=869212 RepID=I4B2U0_TURPD|nr:AbrB/MazE/SpoVT family DNA-binding domain-containing protein [Turneriella parva]AFM11597.1 transcriptional regulator, AbrB family [Turneriella parva DSM 21527]
MTSKITSKYQVTIPKRIRDRMHLEINSAIEWVVEGGKVVVKKAESPILKYRGFIKTGPGDIDADIAAARDNYLKSKFGK